LFISTRIESENDSSTAILQMAGHHNAILCRQSIATWSSELKSDVNAAEAESYLLLTFIMLRQRLFGYLCTHIEIMKSQRPLIFLCSGAAKSGNKKPSFKIASEMIGLGLADIGTLQDLSAQQATPPDQQKRMIFINDCRSSCVNVFTTGITQQNYIMFDVSQFLTVAEFDIQSYIKGEMIPMIEDKWMP
jgi:hypothetical protein